MQEVAERENMEALPVLEKAGISLGDIEVCATSIFFAAAMSIHCVCKLRQLNELLLVPGRRFRGVPTYCRLVRCFFLSITARACFELRAKDFDFINAALLVLVIIQIQRGRSGIFGPR